MATIAERMNAGLNIRRMKQVDLVEKTKIGKSSISTYLAGEYEPKQKNLYKIAQALNVNEAWLMGLDVPMEKTNIDHTTTINNILPIATRKIPLLGEIACGIPQPAEECFECYVDIGTDIQADFCLKAKGDSMINARIFDGDIVFIRKQSDVSDGEIAVVYMDGEATLKRVRKYADRLQLIAENPTIKPIDVFEKDFETVCILGKAVAFQGDVQ
jgi:SOS-response transcriptional repressors (RecA-mediated autopeptidases)